MRSFSAMGLVGLVSSAFLGLGTDAGALPTVPGPAAFGSQIFLDENGTTGEEIDTGLVSFPQAFVAQTPYTTTGGGSATLTSQSNIAASGAPFVKAVVDVDYLGGYGVTGRVSSAMSYQIVLTGGTPGALTPVGFGTFGELTNTSYCGSCPSSSWLSASALLQLRDPATNTDYFLLNGGSSQLYQTGTGTTPISTFTTLNLPIDVPLDVILGVTTYAYSQELWLGQPVGPVQSFAFLDPTFTPLDSSISVLYSSNLIAVPEASTAGLLGALAGLALAAGARSRRPERRAPVH